MSCERLSGSLCGDCPYCLGVLVTRPIDTLTPEEWMLIRMRFRRVNGLRPQLRLVRSGDESLG